MTNDYSNGGQPVAQAAPAEEFDPVWTIGEQGVAITDDGAFVVLDATDDARWVRAPSVSDDASAYLVYLTEAEAGPSHIPDFEGASLLS